MYLLNFCLTGQKYPFTFDKVFSFEASQQDVFVEISQLVQSALDGYKVILLLSPGISVQCNSIVIERSIWTEVQSCHGLLGHIATLES